MTTAAGRNLIVLSDGTGNSASKSVQDQCVAPVSGPGPADGSRSPCSATASAPPASRFCGSRPRARRRREAQCAQSLQVPVPQLLAGNLRRPDTERSHLDVRFSRGAYTIRVLVGLVHSEGLVTFETEADLDRNAIAAYRAFRKKAFPAKAWWVFWVPLGRWIRDRLISLVARRRRRQPLRGCGTARDGSKSISWACGTRSPPMACRSTSSRCGRQMGLADELRGHLAAGTRAARAARAERWTTSGEPSTRSPGTRRTEKLPREDSASIPIGSRRSGFPACTPMSAAAIRTTGSRIVPLCWMIDEADKQDLEFEPVVDGEYVASPRRPGASMIRAPDSARSGATSRAMSRRLWARASRRSCTAAS